MVYLDPKNDVTFKKVFGTHKNICISLLNSLIELPDDAIIESVEYEDTNILPANDYNKNSIVDVKCVDTLGRSFIVEMQLYWSESFMSRTLLNVAKTYANQTYKGQEFRDIQPVYALCLLNDVYLKEEEYKKDFIHRYAIRCEDHPELTIKGMEFVFVEMPKFVSGNKAHNKMANLWLSYMNDVQGKTSISEIAPELVNEPIIKEAIEYLEEFSYTKEERYSYDRYWDYISTQKSAHSDAVARGERRGREIGRAEGIAEGRAEGRAEGIVEGAKKERVSNILNMKAEGCTVEMISKLLRLSIEEVEKVLKNDKDK